MNLNFTNNETFIRINKKEDFLQKVFFKKERWYMKYFLLSSLKITANYLDFYI